MKVGGEFVSLYGAHTHSMSGTVHHSFAVVVNGCDCQLIIKENYDDDDDVLFADQCRLHNENFKYD